MTGQGRIEVASGGTHRDPVTQLTTVALLVSNVPELLVPPVIRWMNAMVDENLDDLAVVIDGQLMQTQ